MAEVKLGKVDEQLRRQAEYEALRHWPGARVLVHGDGDRYRAAVHLPEDGVSLSTSAERSEPHSSPHDALEEVLSSIKAQKASLDT
jgi:hypothetical protein